ncbi:hypothetical protein RJ55_08694 [Drechmeria coniospora]|nr:hypothetical protein RJ55_08694 [Drechmeria coniospora]
MNKRSNECSPDVAIYWSVRQEYRKGLAFGDQAWEVQNHKFSSKHTRNCAHRLLNNEALRVAFDPVLEVPGLRDGMMISTLNKLFGTRCDEEAANYLAHIITTYLRIVQSRQAMVKIASEDVRALELRCPKYCAQDAEEIKTAMDRGQIFKAFNETERKVIRKEILSLGYIIPSLHTFFKDMYLLEDCASSMKYLWSATTAAGAGLTEEAHEDTIHEFAKLAQDLGFQSPEIECLAQTNDGAEISQRTEVNAELPSQDHLAGCHDAVLASLVVKSPGKGKRQLKRRCGRPRYKTYCPDRTFLIKEFLDYDYDGLGIQGTDITTFFVLRSQYLAFFNMRNLHCQRFQSKSPDINHQYLTTQMDTLPPAVGESIMRSRRYSEYSDVTVVSFSRENAIEAGDGGSMRADSATASEKKNPQMQQRTIQVVFKTFKEGIFITVTRVNAGDPLAIAATARALVRDDAMKLFSVTLQPISEENCFDTALESGLNTIIVLPANNFEISVALRRAAGQLRRED